MFPESVYDGVDFQEWIPLEDKPFTFRSSKINHVLCLIHKDKNKPCPLLNAPGGNPQWCSKIKIQGDFLTTYNRKMGNCNGVGCNSTRDGDTHSTNFGVFFRSPRQAGLEMILLETIYEGVDFPKWIPPQEVSFLFRRSKRTYVTTNNETLLAIKINFGENCVKVCIRLGGKGFD